MTYINLTNITAGNSTLEVITTINTELTSGLFGLFILISLFVILFINLDAGSSKETFAVTTFIVSTIAGFFWLAGIVAYYYLIVCIILLFTSIILLFVLD